jgi:hypothetical protein
MALFAAQQWSLAKLKDESLTVDHSTPDLMVIGEPPPEFAAAVDPVLN